MISWSNKNIKENGILQGDMSLWMIFLLLCFISIITVYSASSNMTYSTGKYWAPVMRHGSFVLLGIGFTWLLHMIPCRLYKIFGLGIMLFSQILLICALFAGKVNGAARWVGIGDFSFQPSEIAKLGLVITTAFILSVFRDKNGASTFGFKIVAGNVLFTLAFIFSENLSTAALIFVVMFLMCIYAQVPSKILIWLGGVLIGGALSVYLILVNIPQTTLDYLNNSPDKGLIHRVPTWRNRLVQTEERPENPKEYNITKNVQVTHAMIAIASCGITGRGPGNSVQRDFLPQAFSDFIYAILIEEWGIGGASAVMFLYLLLLYRALRLSQRCKSLFPAFLIMGLSLMLVVQAMINMAVAVGAIPVTGQPLPLISRGGTSTFVNCAYFGIMLSVSRSARKIEEKKDNKEEDVKEIPVQA